MVLKKIIEQSARWNSEANTWWVGETETYYWTDNKENEISPRMKFSEAIHWIIRYDQGHQEKNLEFRNPEEGSRK